MKFITAIALLLTHTTVAADYTLFGRGLCISSTNEEYSAAYAALPSGEAAECSAWCKTNDLPELIAFEFELVPSRLCACLYDYGRLPLPLPVFSNPSARYIAIRGTGPVDAVKAGSSHAACYVYEKGTAGPTAYPTQAPVIPTPSSAPTPTPTQSPTNSPFPTMAIPPFAYSRLGPGFCIDRNLHAYSKAYTTLSPDSTDAQCARWCKSNDIPELLGFEFERQSGLARGCACLYVGGKVPQPPPVFRPPATYFDDLGDGPVLRTTGTPGNLDCYLYDATPSPSPTTLTSAPTKAIQPYTYKYFGRGLCLSSTFHTYSRALGYLTGSTVNNIESHCAHWCKTNDIPELLGFELEPATFGCACLYDGGKMPMPQPIFNPAATQYTNEMGVGPVVNSTGVERYASCFTYGVVTATPTEAPSVNVLNHYTKVGEGVCRDSQNNDYSQVMVELTPSGDPVQDFYISESYCAQNKDIANYVGFEYTSFPQHILIRCYFSGGLPSPLPVYNPTFDLSDSHEGSGAIAQVAASPGTSCYGYNKFGTITYAPTPSPTTSPSIDNLSLHTKVGDGFCVDSKNRYFSSIEGQVTSSGDLFVDSFVAANWCSQHKGITTYIGFDYTMVQPENNLLIHCFFSGGLPNPLPVYTPPSIDELYRGVSGTISQVIPVPDTGCYSYNNVGPLPTFSPTTAPNGLNLHTKVGEGWCTDSQRRPYSSIEGQVTSSGAVATDALIAANWCSQHKEIMTYIGFDFTMVQPENEILIHCHFSGGLPEPLPVYTPPSIDNLTREGSGSITQVIPLPDSECYSYNNVGPLPTYSPSRNPQTLPPTVSSNTVWQVVGLGFCTDIAQEQYSYIGASLPAGSNPEDCSNYCLQNRVVPLIGFVVDQQIADTKCYCQFRDGLPSPEPDYVPEAVFSVVLPGSGPMTGTTTPTGNAICCEYLIGDGPGPAPATSHPTVVGSKSTKNTKSQKSEKSAKSA